MTRDCALVDLDLDFDFGGWLRWWSVVVGRGGRPSPRAASLIE